MYTTYVAFVVAVLVTIFDKVSYSTASMSLSTTVLQANKAWEAEASDTSAVAGEVNLIASWNDCSSLAGDSIVLNITMSGVLPQGDAQTRVALTQTRTEAAFPSAGTANCELAAMTVTAPNNGYVGGSFKHYFFTVEVLEATQAIPAPSFRLRYQTPDTLVLDIIVRSLLIVGSVVIVAIWFRLWATHHGPMARPHPGVPLLEGVERQKTYNHPREEASSSPLLGPSASGPLQHYPPAAPKRKCCYGCRHRPRELLPQQRWVGILLIGVLAWQNPLIIIIEAIGDGPLFLRFAAEFLFSFGLMWLLGFWLLTIDGLRLLPQETDGLPRTWRDPAKTQRSQGAARDDGDSEEKGMDSSFERPNPKHRKVLSLPGAIYTSLSDRENSEAAAAAEAAIIKPYSKLGCSFYVPKLAFFAVFLGITFAMEIMRQPVQLYHLNYNIFLPPLGHSCLQLVFILCILFTIFLAIWFIWFVMVNIATSRYLRLLPYSATRFQQLSFRFLSYQQTLLVGSILALNLYSLIRFFYTHTTTTIPEYGTFTAEEAADMPVLSASHGLRSWFPFLFEQPTEEHIIAPTSSTVQYSQADCVLRIVHSLSEGVLDTGWLILLSVYAWFVMLVHTPPNYKSLFEKLRDKARDVQQQPFSPQYKGLVQAALDRARARERLSSAEKVARGESIGSEQGLEAEVAKWENEGIWRKRGTTGWSADELYRLANEYPSHFNLVTASWLFDLAWAVYYDPPGEKTASAVGRISTIPHGFTVSLDRLNTMLLLVL